MEVNRLRARIPQLSMGLPEDPLMPQAKGSVNQARKYRAPSLHLKERDILHKPVHSPLPGQEENKRS